jgi:hypothetical protein
VLVLAEAGVQMDPLVADMLPPPVVRIEAYGRPRLERKHASKVFMPRPLIGMSLEQQAQACRRLLRLLGQRWLDPIRVEERSAPFKWTPAQRVAVPLGHMPGLQPRAGQQAAERGALMREVVVHEWRALCMPHTKATAYLRIALCGKRPGNTTPVMEWAHRLVCWIAHGAPPNNAWHVYEAAHLCGNPKCLTPAHLAWLTPVQNTACRAWHKANGRGWNHVWPGQ